MNQSLSDLPMLAPMLYTPADRPDLATVLSGRRDLGICSVAVCLEDAVRPENRQAAAEALCLTLASLDSVPRSVFIRPADVAALEWLIEHLPLEHISGFILPKATVATIHLWVERSAGLHTLLPILESREALDPVGRRELAQACAAHPPLIPGARIGVNDLFSLLGGLRRPLGRTIYETPVGRVIDELLEAFSAHSVRLCGPVFDRIQDLETLSREVSEDVHRGLHAKTAVTPRQVQIIWERYLPNDHELEEARCILEPDGPAVLGLHGSMLERACHTAWAKGLLARAATHAAANRIRTTEATSTLHDEEPDHICISTSARRII